jgi:hypothetical protein
MEFIGRGIAGMPVMDFANVIPLEQQASEHHVNVGTPDTASEDGAPSLPREKPPATSPPQLHRLQTEGL